jgi:hypothetical protein
MRLISPDVLLDARELSIGATGFFLFVGFLLWSLGWRWHKFWVVFAVTLTAGILGIGAGRSAGMQVLVVGVLVALAAGLLALEIAKIVAFITGGTVAWLAAQAVMPEAHELWAVFLCGGLIGVVLYRLWTMLAASFIGVLVFGHALLLIIESLSGGQMNAIEFAEKYAAPITGWVVVTSILGVLVQSWTSQDAGEAKASKPAEKKESKLSEWWIKVLPMKKAA